MRHFSKSRIIGEVVLLFALGVMLLVGLFRNGAVVGGHEIQTDIRLEIGLWTKGTLIEQTFASSRNNLSRIDFWVRSYRPWDSPSLECRLFEFDGQEPIDALSYRELHSHFREVRVKRLNGWMFSPHMFNRFEFEPIPDSQGKRYLLSIRSPELKRGGSSILLASARKRLDVELFLVNGIRMDSDLAFRALYAQPRLQILQRTFARIALQKPAPFSFSWCYYLLFGGYLIIMVLLARLL